MQRLSDEQVSGDASAPARRGLPRPIRVLLTLLAVAVVFILGITAFTEGWARFAGAKPENRFALYALREQVSPGMTAEELRRVLSTETSKKVEHRWFGDGGVSAWTHLGFWRVATLSIELREGKVVHAMIQDDDDGRDRLKDAPPDF
jgi:hypothetical protein